ncbi:MAG: tetratricopeptide repeat protein [Spirochaetaceae bacterium]|jgi:tetratricopeptide (TPR) repeat protein|nr:tetratricopeptide repeat protein [Spirochaetaceae bacterium]
MQETECSPGVENLKKEAFKYLKEGDAGRAIEIIESALRIDYDEPELLWTLKCVSWWLEKIKCLEGIPSPYDRGIFIMSQWKGFYGFLDKIGGSFDNGRYAVRRFVSALALENFKEVLSEGGLRHDPVLDLQIGRCYKGSGEYEAALEYIQKAARHMRESGEALAELADVEALLGEAKQAKVLFREAFFVDPEKIEVRSMESQEIVQLAGMVRKTGVPSDTLAEWIPVYGALFGVFSVKRELKASELSRLKQEIFTYENDVRNNNEEKNILVPRLLNRYLWLLDHYENTNESGASINEVLYKIKFIDAAIYDRYMSVKGNRSI